MLYILFRLQLLRSILLIIFRLFGLTVLQKLRPQDYQPNTFQPVLMFWIRLFPESVFLRYKELFLFYYYDYYVCVSNLLINLHINSTRPNSNYFPVISLDCCFSLQRVIKMIRDELYDAVYSDEYTSNHAALPMRVPYAILVNRLRTARNLQAENAITEREKLRKRMMETEKQLQSANAQIEKLQSELLVCIIT